MRLRSRKNWLFGLLALTVTVAILVRMLDVFPAYINDVIGRSLPVVLVIVGISVMLRNRVPFGGIIAIILGGVLVAGVSTTAFSVREDQNRDDNRIEIDEEMGDQIVLLRVRLQTLATDVELVRAPAGSDDRTVRTLFLGSMESDISAAYTEEADRTATLALTEQRPNPFPMLEAVGRGTLLVELPPGMPADVQVNAADGDVSVNFTGVDLERLNVDVNEGDVIISLPDYEPTYSRPEETLGTWRVGTGALTIRIPEEIAARFDMSQSSGPDPDYDPNDYNLLFGRDILEARNFDTAETVIRYDLVVQRDGLSVDVTE